MIMIINYYYCYHYYMINQINSSNNINTVTPRFLGKREPKKQTTNCSNKKAIQ